MKKQKKNLIRIISAFVIFMIGLLLPADEEVKLVIFLAAFAIAGLDVVLRALRNITRGQVFDENFLMSIATIGAFFVGEYPEAAAVMLFYQTGELFASYAVAQSRKSIAELMDIRPEYANVLREGGTLTVSPEEVVPGELILIKPGERIPLDGEVVKGNSTADTSALTGESMPRELSQGSTVISGCINLNGILTVKVSKGYEECTVAKILELVENAGSRKAVAEKFITKFAKYYTPIVVIIALLLALVPPLFISGEEFSGWIYRALIFLVVSCPCALVISIPLGFFGGIGGASRRGILVKGSNYLEALAAAEIVVFDKTGTLTKGNFVLTGIYPEGINQEELLELTAKAEIYSNHPISLSIKKAYGKEIFEGSISQTEEIPGYGMMAVVDGMRVYAGNERLMKSKRISYKANNDTGTVVYVALDGIFIGSLTISDEIKADAPLAIQGLKEAGIRKTVILTGDAQSIGVKVAGELGVDEVYAELLPADKVKRMEELFREKSEKGKLVFVGDGINDAPVLARADIGIAMGGLGSDAAIEAADIVIMTDEPSKIKDAIDISKRTLRIVKQNIVFALGVKAAVLLLGAAGMADMWEAVFADVGVSVIAILNSIRILKRN